MPPAEVILWNCFATRVERPEIQKAIQHRSVYCRFYCAQLKLAIEIDGESHYAEGARDRDRIRQEFIESAGAGVLQVHQQDVYERLEGVVQRY